MVFTDRLVKLISCHYSGACPLISDVQYVPFLEWLPSVNFQFSTEIGKPPKQIENGGKRPKLVTTPKIGVVCTMVCTMHSVIKN